MRPSRNLNCNALREDDVDDDEAYKLNAPEGWPKSWVFASPVVVVVVVVVIVVEE